MKKKQPLWIGLLVIASVLITSCVAATPPAAAPAAEGDQAAASGDVETVTVFATQDGNLDLESNAFTQEMEQALGVNFEWQTTTTDGNSAREKRQVALASGDYPAMFLLISWVDQFSKLEQLNYGKQGVLLPLNDLIDQHAPNIKAFIESNPTYKAMATAPDGNIYGLPGWSECYHCSFGNKMWVNTKWLDALGLEMPTTTEEFRAMLEAFKTQDPNGNGIADEVPLSGAIMEYGTRPIPFLMNGFIYDDDRTYLYLDDGKVELAASQPEWKEGLAYIKSLYDAGLIDPGAFTNNADAYKMLGDNADAELLGAGAGMHPAIFVTTGDDAPYGADYDALPPLQGPHANYATWLPFSEIGATFALTNKATPAAQEAAIKLIDYLFTQEGQLRGNFGIEGVDWRRPEAGEVAQNASATPIFAMINQITVDAQANNGWGALATYYFPKELRDGWVQATDIYSSKGYERRLQEATDLYAGNQPDTVFPTWMIWPDPATADAFAMQKTNITDYVNQNALEFITGVKNLDTDWDAYVAGLEQLGLTSYLAANQASYDALPK